MWRLRVSGLGVCVAMLLAGDPAMADSEFDGNLDEARAEGDFARSVPARAEDNGTPRAAQVLDQRAGNAIRVSAFLGDGPYGSKQAGSGDFDWYQITVAQDHTLVVDLDSPGADGVSFPDLVVGAYTWDGVNEPVFLAADDEDGRGRDPHLVYKNTTAPLQFVYLQVRSFGNQQVNLFDSASGDGARSEGPYHLSAAVFGPDGPHYLMDTGSLWLLSDQAELKIQSTHATSAPRNLLELINRGASRIVFTDAATGGRWELAQDANGDFCISRRGSVGPKTGAAGCELVLHKNGRVRMGPGNDTAFDLRPNGDLFLAGNLTLGGVCTNCSAGKTGASGHDVEARLAALEAENRRLRDRVHRLEAAQGTRR